MDNELRESLVDVDTTLSILKINISASFDPNGYNKYDYDLYFVDNEILLNNRKYFVNLYDYLPKEHINMYNPKLLPISNNKLYGLPLSIRFPVLYYNQTLLDKYELKKPSTWNELLNYGKYILEEEKKKNSTKLIGYNGLFDDNDNSNNNTNTNINNSNSEVGTNSIYEFIYSFRNDIKFSYPDLIIIDEDFKLDENESLSSRKLINYIFYKNYYMRLLNKKFHYNILSGNKSELSGVIPSNFNIAICISSLYDDNDVCEKVDCNFIKRLQFTSIQVVKEEIKNNNYSNNNKNNNGSNNYSNSLCLSYNGQQLGEMQHFNTTPLGEMQSGEMQFGEMQLSLKL
ncbi:hypothetical protein U3516DRAFT_754851 [Neocallimastix sp. 'constans']